VFLPETVQHNHLIRSVILASYRYHSAPSDHAPVLVTYYQQPIKKAISNFITNHDIESFNSCQCTECKIVVPYKDAQYNKYSMTNGYLQACANLGMIINEFKVGNSTSSQEKKWKKEKRHVYSSSLKHTGTETQKSLRPRVKIKLGPFVRGLQTTKL
jgi:hypothetical protein